MSAELKLGYPSAANVYAIMRRVSDFKVWNAATFVTWVDADIADYDVALTDRSGDFYSADFPALITGAGNYSINYYLRAGGTPATSDTLLDTETIYWNGGAASAAPVGGDPVTVGQLVTILRTTCRNAGISDPDDTTYSLAEKHLAIQALLDDFIERTHCVIATNNFTITEDDEDVDLSGIAGFESRRTLQVWINSENLPLTVAGIVKVNDLLSQTDTSALPTTIAFVDSAGVGKLYPIPSDDYTGKVMWWAPLTSFDAGDTGIANLELNVPASLARQAIYKGGIWFLQKNQPDHEEIVAQSKAEYDEFVMRSMGAANLGVREVQRIPPHRRVGRGW